MLRWVALRKKKKKKNSRPVIQFNGFNSKDILFPTDHKAAGPVENN